MNKAIFFCVLILTSHFVLAESSLLAPISVPQSVYGLPVDRLTDSDATLERYALAGQTPCSWDTGWNQWICPDTDISQLPKPTRAMRRKAIQDLIDSGFLEIRQGLPGPVGCAPGHGTYSVGCVYQPGE